MKVVHLIFFLREFVSNSEQNCVYKKPGNTILYVFNRTSYIQLSYMRKTKCIELIFSHLEVVIIHTEQCMELTLTLIRTLRLISLTVLSHHLLRIPSLRAGIPLS